MSVGVILVAVGVALMVIGWATAAGDLSNILFLVGLAFAVVGVIGALARRF